MKAATRIAGMIRSAGDQNIGSTNSRNTAVNQPTTARVHPRNVVGFSTRFVTRATIAGVV